MSHKQLLLASSLLGVLLLTSPAFAQDPAPPTLDSNEVDELVVTGTRIRLQDYVSPNPVTSVTAEAVELSGQTNVTQFLQDIPALVNSIDLETGADVNANFDGLSLLNLRSLGASRTLVLVDGRRHVASNPGTSNVDVSAIPAALIERVEILTGGASAIYGADGVTGVVNFILKKDFEGLDFRAQKGLSDHGGGGNNFASVLAGKNFAGGRGNFTFGAEYDKTEDLKFEQRDFTRTGSIKTLVDNPDDICEPGSTDCVPGEIDSPRILDQIPVQGLNYYDTSLIGSVYTNFYTAPTLSGATFLTNGQPFIDPDPYYGSAIGIGGSGTPIDFFNDDLIPGWKRYSLYSTGSFKFTDALEGFAELKYTNSLVDFEGQPSYDYGLFISQDNPYLPADILADAQTDGGFAFDADGGPEGPGLGLPGPGVLLARDNFYLGRSQQETENETFRAVAGVRGTFLDNLDFELSYVFGRAVQTIDYTNQRFNDRYYAATDVIADPLTGQPTCRINVDPTAGARGDAFGQFSYGSDILARGATFTPGANSGCLPLNVFGDADPAAIDWVIGEGRFKSELTQHVVNGFITGDSSRWFSLPAGAPSFVLGAEYRSEKSTSTPDALQTLAEDIDYANLTQLGRVVPTNAKYDVTEGFAELSIPLLKDLRSIKELTVTAAYRYSDYSSVGYTETYNVGGRWRINDNIMLRGTKARAVRAPSINDLYRGRQQTFAPIVDPCDRNNIRDGDNPSQRAAACATAFTALGVPLANYEDTSSETTSGFLTGNPNLDPEKADTSTIGAVFTPSFIPGLSISVDYYDIEIADAIASYSVQTIVNNCYDLPTGNPFCALIERTSGGVNPGRVATFEQIPGNLSSFSTSGYDFNLRYVFDPRNLGIERDIGTFGVGLIVNKIETLQRLETADAPVNVDVGEEGSPEWQANVDLTWRRDRWTVNYGFSWFDETSRYSNVTLASQPDIAAEEWKYYDARRVHDVQVRYQPRKDLAVYFGVNNLTDQEPQPSGYGDASYPVSAMGRYFYAGLNVKFDSLSDMWSR